MMKQDFTIGIDFGTSFSCASFINPKTNAPEAIRFLEDGKEKMPSIVYFSPDEIMVGSTAYEILQESMAYEREESLLIQDSVVTCIKRDMRRGQVIRLPENRTVTHEEVIAEIFKKIKSDVETGSFQNNPADKAVITHPANFPEWKKYMLRKAGSLAGFHEIELLEEPVAAAIGYYTTNNLTGQGILVYDFGGGTFDIAFVLKDEQGFRIPISPDGDDMCGGEDIDLALYEYFDKYCSRNYGKTFIEGGNSADKIFKDQCRKIKELLSATPKISRSVKLPAPVGGLAVLNMTRKEFDEESKIAAIIDNTIRKTEIFLKRLSDAGYKVDHALLIGGSSRIPAVYEKLKNILPVAPLKTGQADIAVALGAVASQLYKVASDGKNTFIGSFKDALNSMAAKKIDDAVSVLMALVEKENEDAENIMGIIFQYGLWTNVDMQEAVKLFKKSSQRGNRYAQYNLGWCLQRGYGVNKNKIEALQWYNKSADKGYIPAEVGAALLLYKDNPTVQTGQVITLLKNAASKGDLVAETSLALILYIKSRETQSSFLLSEARHLLGRAKSRGYDLAKEISETFLHFGFYFLNDPAKAAESENHTQVFHKILDRLAEQNHTIRKMNIYPYGLF